MIGLGKGYMAVVVDCIVVGRAVDCIVVGRVVVVDGKTIVRWYHVVGHMDVDMDRSRNNPQVDMTCNFFYVDQDTQLGAQEVHRQLVLLLEHRDDGYSNARIRPEILWPNH
ncbi:hypothetical protein QL285_039212 [Trifolium repens]|nr:hypothetical protein QL285_039212 [Trifolium repens]